LYHGSKTISARLVSKDDIAPYTAQGGHTGTLFHIVVSDAPHMTLRCTFFDPNDEVHEKLQVGKVYMFQGGQLRHASNQYNTCTSKFSMTFNNKSSFEEMNEIDVDTNAVETPADIVYVPICDLAQGNGSPSIRARVFYKTDVKSWNNGQRNGCVFSVELDDCSGTTIRGTFFNASAEKFDNLLQVDETYTFSGGMLRLSDHGYDKCTSPFEFRFEEHSKIDIVPRTIQELHFNG